MPAEPKIKKRPVSPHLTIYKAQISSVLSIGHRMSGVSIFFLLIVLSWCFSLWVFNDFDPLYPVIFTNPIIKLILILASFGFFFHLTTGIRHLIWDMGYGFSIKSVNFTGWLAVIIALLMTIMLWFYCCDLGIN